MFEKTKDLCYEIYGISAETIINKKIKYVELKKEDLKYSDNGYANIIKYVHFNDDNNRILFSIPEFTDLLLKTIVLFENDINWDKIYDLLISNIKDKAEGLGLSLHTNYIYGVYFGIDDKNKLNLFKKQDNSILFYGDKNYNFILPEEYGALNYGTLIDNKIVSHSGSTYLSPFNSEVVDISISTHENYRQKGYGVSNVISLAEYLLSGNEEVRQVKEVMYCTNNQNIYSQKTARSAGFIEIAKEFVISCRQI